MRLSVERNPRAFRLTAEKTLLRASAIEPIIGHVKSEHRLERNRLKGTLGNAINALRSAAAMNFGK